MSSWGPVRRPEATSVAFADDDEHLEIDDDEADELPDFAGPHEAGPFSGDHCSVELVILGKVEFFWF